MAQTTTKTVAVQPISSSAAPSHVIPVKRHHRQESSLQGSGVKCPRYIGGKSGALVCCGVLFFCLYGLLLICCPVDTKDAYLVDGKLYDPPRLAKSKKRKFVSHTGTEATRADSGQSLEAGGVVWPPTMEK